MMNRKQGSHRIVKSLMALARTLGMPYQRVQRAALKGIFGKSRDGFYDAKEAGRLILEQEATAPGRQGRPPSEWDERLKRAKALREETELAKLSGELMLVSDHIRETVGRELELKDRTLGLPSEVAALCAMKPAREVEAILFEKMADIWRGFARKKRGD